jgi:hypothetical protein
LAAKEQIFICGSVVDEEIAYRYLAKRNDYFPAIKKDMLEKLFTRMAFYFELKGVNKGKFLIVMSLIYSLILFVLILIKASFGL